MERVWAPWRMEFVEKGSKVQGCIFCLFPAEIGDEADRRNLILGRSAHAFVILNRFPYTSGHLMVIPRRHTAVLEELPADEIADVSFLLQKTVKHLKDTYKPDGFNVGMNLGHSAGAGIADHLHWHVVPRWTGDTNFMPVVSDTRVMIEQLDRTWEKLRPLFTPPT
jgi:ATP adenylyltransferase